MKNLIVHPDYQLYERKGITKISSVQVAEIFGKEHRNIMRDIEERILGVAPEDFSALNFERTSYRTDQNKKHPMYLVTKNGFALLTMGFTGKKAMQFKVDYINRFDQMETFIKSLASSRLEHPAFTEAVMLAHEEPKHYHFSNEIDMINRIVLGRSAKAIREEYGLAKGESIRPYLSEREITDIMRLQVSDVGMLQMGLEFPERKAALESAHAKRMLRIHGIKRPQLMEASHEQPILCL